MAGRRTIRARARAAAGARALRVALGVVAALAAGCIAEVGIEGAPCPCPSGYECCASLGGTCIPVAAECPASAPPSGSARCERDEDCPRGELCRAWSGPDGAEGGPGECRRACDGTFPCADGERCAPTLHDGLPLDATNVALACQSADPEEGCEACGCAGSGVASLGRTRCEDDTVRGCFLALHPTCGLVCHDLLVEVCDDRPCVAGADGAVCQPGRGGPEPCATFPCGACEPAAPGATACDGDAVVACVTLPTWDGLCLGPCECDRLCRRDVLASCPNGCVEDDAGARCVP